MKKVIFLALIFTVIIARIGTISFADGRRSDVPNVPFLSPDDETTIDLTGKQGIIFK